MKKIAIFFTGLLFTLTAKPQSFAIDSMKRILRATSTVDTNKIQLYLQLSREWAKINTDSAFAYSEKSFQLSSDIKYVSGQADARIIQGKLSMESGEYAKAYEYYMEAFHKYTLLNNETGVAAVYNGLGDTYIMQEDYTKALKYFTQALNTFQKMGSREEVAKTYLRIGALNFRTYNNDKALQSYEKALEIANAIHNKKIAANAYNNIGTVYSQMGLYNKALTALIRSKNLSLISNMLPAVAESYMHIGTAFREIKNFDSSYLSFNIALNYYIQLKNQEGIAKTYQGLSELFVDKKDLVKAKEFIRLSNEYAGGIKNNLILFDNYKMLVYISKFEGDYTAAFDFYDKLLVLKDSLFNAEKVSSIERLKSGYELEQKQETINELQEENSVKTRQRNTLFIAFGIAALLMILLCFSILQIKRKRKLLLVQKAELESQKKELEELHVVKDKFFSILSHDLRSPMVNILGLLNIISSDNSISERDKNLMFESLKSSTTSTLETMDNMLAWGKQQIKDNKSEIEEVNIHEVADRVCRFLKHSADNKSIQFVNHINSDVHIMADNNRLEFVLRNLMSNALKFSHYNSKVELWTSADDTYVNIHVKDFGTGMKKELQERLFDVNKTQSTQGTAGEMGTGLGLILSKEFINQNNGSLLVSSNPGEGTTFTIRHPWSLS
jgi:signal transduction histidine kinase